MKRFIVYEIKNNLNGKMYIGQYSGSNFDSYFGSGKLIKAAIQKYGLENFTKNILEECENKEGLNSREKYWIKEMCAIKNGYNLTEGGTGGDASSFINYTDPEYLAKKSKITKQYWDSLSAEAREERSTKVRGQNNGMFGKEGYWKGKQKPVELIERSRNNRRSYEGDSNPNWKGGRTFCDCGARIASESKTCGKCRDRSGANNTFYGKTHSEEAIQKMKQHIKETRKAGWLPGNARKISIDGQIFSSLKESCTIIGLSATAMIGRLKSAKYPSWVYIEKL